MQVIWDLCHYGWPDDLDIFKPEFIDRFARFAKASAQLLRDETFETCYFSPVNEISFFAWGGGEEAILNPYQAGRGAELKRQLVRASIEAMEAIWSVLPDARMIQVDPLINIVLEPGADAGQRAKAEAHVRAQFEAWDMLAGRTCPQLGGAEKYLDILGANYYVHNQWVQDGKFITREDPRYRPLHTMLRALYQKYRRPLFIAETGIEDERRPQWFAYICDEVITALRVGVPVEGVCLYPIVNHPGWEDERHCHNGLWDYCDDSGEREIYQPLADELVRQTARINALRSDVGSIGSRINILYRPVDSTLLRRTL
jgi:beta-glucosidase/6-phospho-beta-glucosidase/beta-galactosidase